jgi:eukaryotic-like serine/threonine-protein kinase
MRRTSHRGRALVTALIATPAIIVSTSMTAGWAARTADQAPASQRGTQEAAAKASQGWPAFLHGPKHSSYSPGQTAIRPGNARGLVSKWQFMPRREFLSSPVVAHGSVYIGSSAGWFYQLDEATGKVLHKAFIGFQRRKTCRSRGVVDTATVAVDPADHQPTVYVGGPSGYLYAFSAANLSLRWKSVIAIPSRTSSNYFDWSSPTIADGRIYIGVSSNCDNPLIRGGLISYSQETGKRLAQFFTIPAGTVGGSVWSSVAVADGYAYVSTGNGPPSSPRLSYSESIVKLNPKTLKVVGQYQIPAAEVTFDADFGGSPVIFGRYVGACNKNGIFYAVNRATMKLGWEARIGAPSGNAGYSQCSAAPAFDGKHLFFGGPGVSIGGTSFGGSAQERSPSSGRVIWETGLRDGVIGSPSVDGAGVLAVGTFDGSGNGVYLLSAATGKIVRTLVQGEDFAQAAFADGWIFTANAKGVRAWGHRHS